MLLGMTGWKTCEDFYNSLSLAKDGIADEQDFARRPRIRALFPRYEIFWRRHICPATTRPHGTDFRAGISAIICKIAQTSYSILGGLLDAADSLDKVRAGDLGPRCRNCRDVLMAAGNTLQLLRVAVLPEPQSEEAERAELGPLPRCAPEPVPGLERALER